MDDAVSAVHPDPPSPSDAHPPAAALPLTPPGSSRPFPSQQRRDGAAAVAETTAAPTPHHPQRLCSLPPPPSPTGILRAKAGTFLNRIISKSFYSYTTVEALESGEICHN